MTLSVRQPAICFVAFVALLAAACRIPFSRGLPTLTTIQQIRDLSPAEADRRYPVRLKAVTTYHDPALKILMMQDATGGIKVSLLNQRMDYDLGDVLTVQGITARGEPYPIVQNAVVQRVGQKPMPVPVRLTPAEMDAPEHQDQYAETRGIISTWAERQDGRIGLRVSSGGVMFDAIVLHRDALDVKQLISAQAKIRGVVRALSGVSGRVLARQMFVGGMRDVQLETSSVPPVRTPASAAPAALVATAEQLHALVEADWKKSIHVRLHGVITFYDPNWHQLFFQDATGGVFIHCPGFSQVSTNDLVEVSGTAECGGFAPMVGSASIHVLGKAAPPAPTRLSMEDLFSGRYDSRRVQVTGVVQAITRQYGHVYLDVAAGLYRYRYRIHLPWPETQAMPMQLVDASVRVRGVAGTIANERQQLTGIRVFVPALQDIQVLEAGRGAQGIAVRPINTLLRFSVRDDWQRRVRVQGTVEYQRLRLVKCTSRTPPVGFL